MEAQKLIAQLRREIVLARQRIYRIAKATPLDCIKIADGPDLFVKREDLSPIRAYKWRGAYNAMALLEPEVLKRGVVTASAGNHAQGVALAARQLNTRAVIYMPQSTPMMKQVSVRRLGGDHVEVRLHGDTYDAASEAAHRHCEEKGGRFIHPYDDLHVMAGQGTLADEIVMSGDAPFDRVFLQVGGGGMAAATATWLKLNFPSIQITGVEAEGQASMQAAIEAGKPVQLPTVDVFCDGTAVRKVGELTFAICRELIDDWMTVSNDEVSAAIQFMWEELRCIPEPSGAIGLAAVLRLRPELAGQRVVTVLCGANMDFAQLALIARRSAVGAARRHFLRLRIDERRGSLLGLLQLLPATTNIVDMQYGKTDEDSAWPVLGFDLTPVEFDRLRAILGDSGYQPVDVTRDADVAFRLIHYEPRLFARPAFIAVEFHERPGALLELLQVVSPHAGICYFNYAYTGERAGRALIGLDFHTDEELARLETVLEEAREAYRSYERVPEPVAERIHG